MTPAPVSRQCASKHHKRFYGRKCNCENRKISSESCSFWDDMTEAERRDAGIMWRIGYSGDYGIIASRKDYIEAKEIIKKMYINHDKATLDWWENLNPEIHIQL